MAKLPRILRKILVWRFNRGDDQNENMKELVSAYKAFADTKTGQIILNDLLSASNVGKDPYMEGDPHGTSRNAGMQRIGLRILSFIGTDLSQYVILEKEMRDEQQEHKQVTTSQTAELGEGRGKQAIL